MGLVPTVNLGGLGGQRVSDVITGDGSAGGVCLNFEEIVRPVVGRRRCGQGKMIDGEMVSKHRGELSWRFAECSRQTPALRDAKCLCGW